MGARLTGSSDVSIGAGPPNLRGRRVFLRPAEKTDIATLVAWLNDAGLIDMLGGRGLASTAGMRRWLDDLRSEQGRTRWHFLVCLHEGERPIGVTGLSAIDRVNGQAEFAIGLAKSVMRDRGYGTEAARLVLDFGFHDLRLHRVYLDVFAFNTPAIRLYERLGFVHEATLREAEQQHGRRVDVLLMSILREEWELRRMFGSPQPE